MMSKNDLKRAQRLLAESTPPTTVVPEPPEAIRYDSLAEFVAAVEQDRRAQRIACGCAQCSADLARADAIAPPRPATAGQDDSVRDGDGGEERANG
jgi:hypothetical protein